MSALAQSAAVMHAPTAVLPARNWVTHPDCAIFAVPAGFHVEGEVSLPALRHALDALVARHEALRTTFTRAGDGFVQSIHPRLDPELRLLDLAAPDPRAVRAALAAEATRVLAPFDVARGPLLRLTFARTGPGRATLLVAAHHLPVDGWSLRVALAELGELYRAALEGSAPRLDPHPVQYREFVAWQAASTARRLPELERFWRGRLRGLAPLALPTDRPRAAVADHLLGLHVVELREEALPGLRRLARAERATLFIALLAVLDATAAALAGTRDVAVATVVAGRKRPEHEGVVGLCVNHLVLRTRLDGDPTLRELVRRARRTVLDAFAHDDLPYAELGGLLDGGASARSSASWPLWLALHTLVQPTLALGDAVARPFGVTPAEPPHQPPGAWEGEELRVLGVEEDGRLRLVLNFNARLFEPATVARFGAELARVATAFARDPETRLERLLQGAA